MSTPASATRVFLRPLASPLALGFIGLAVDTLLASGLDLHWFPASERRQVALMLIVFGPLVQLVASVFGFLARDAAAATGTGVLAATWLSIGVVTLTTPPGSHSVALGGLLLVAAVAISFAAATAASSKLVPAAVFALAALRFGLSGIREVTGSGGWMHAAGWAGVALCVVALYGALSSELEDQRHRAVLPTLRRGRGALAFDPDLAAQVEHVATEAGVREQL